MCKFFRVSRSGYYAFDQRLGRLKKNAALAEVIAQQWVHSSCIYIPVGVVMVETSGYPP